MATLTLSGPVVPSGTFNVVLRDALFHSPVARAVASTSYYKIEVGVREEGEYTTWIGTWDQSAQEIEASTPKSILDDGRAGMRLKPNQALVVKVTSSGSPATLVGARVNFRMALVGGRNGPATALVASGAQVADPNSRVAIAALERQINEGGLSDWEDPVALADPEPTEAAYDAQDAYNSGTQTVSSTSFTNGNVSLTFTKPSWATVGYAHIAASSDVLGNGGTGIAHAAVGDGMTDHNEKAVTSLTTQGIEVTTFFAGTITATTTFTLRLKRTTNNVDFSRQVIAGFVAWA